MKKGIKDFIYEEEGIGTVEMILILVVLILVVTIFRKEIEALVGKIFGQINASTENVWEKK